MFCRAPAFRLFLAMGLLVTQPSTGIGRPLALPDPTTPASHQQITVEIRNGKTGGRVWHASPYVFLGKAEVENFSKSHRITSLWSDARVDVTAVTPREVRVWVDFTSQDCRFPEGDHQFRAFDFAGKTLDGIGSFDLDTILSKGVVAPNLCSARTQHPEPGVLVIYVVPLTFKERSEM
jgi:hypothetical protein